MPLEPGQSLGHYRVIEKIGAGGMGEVYRAEDTRLGRAAAIKVLPSFLSKDPERLARFQREARVLAALNHPNIAAIHGLEQDGETVFLALELVEGEDLFARMKQGGLARDEILPMASQVAQALEAAHARGIVHRDLKPANIKITPEGRVKVLDFGLAKSFLPEKEAGDATMSPTITSLGTREGVILGTAAYMSPEQARGRAVDHRTDIWAFGCVLYELLTGRLAFHGETISDTIARILEREPDLDAVPSWAPPRVRELLARCLTKDSTRRLQAIGEARIALEEAVSGPATVPGGTGDGETAGGVGVPGDPAGHVSGEAALAAVGSGGAPAGLTPRGRPRYLFPFILVATVAGALAGAAFTSLWRGGAGESPASGEVSQHLSITLPLDQELTPDEHALGFSADGTRLIYSARSGGISHLFERPLDSYDARPIAGTEDAVSFFLSPDGTNLAFFSGTSLKRVSLEGGTPVEVVHNTNWGHGTWGDDGFIYYTPDYSSGLWRVPEAGGAGESLTVPDRSTGTLGHWWPQFLPGGKAILFTDFHTPVSTARVSLLELATGRIRTLVEGGSFARYLPTGHIVFARRHTLMAVPFDLDDLEVRGHPIAVLQGISLRPNTGMSQLSASSTGTLAWIPEAFVSMDRELVWVGRDGKVEPVRAERRPYQDFNLSPDGKRIAVTIADDVWIQDLERGTLTRLTFGEEHEGRPHWTPDGKGIVYRRETPAYDIYLKAADGSGEAVALTDSEFDLNLGSFTPDGTRLMVTESMPETGQDLVILPFPEGGEPVPFRRTPFREQQGAYSPDGRWVAYESDETGRYEIYVQEATGSGGRWQISTSYGDSPAWSPDGRELFFRSGDKVMGVEISVSGSGLAAGSPREIFSGRYEDADNHITMNISPDGRRFLMLRTPPEAAPREIRIITHWFDELVEKVPQPAR